MRKFKRQLRDAYRFPGFVPAKEVLGMFGDPNVRVVLLLRRQKKRFVRNVGAGAGVFTIAGLGWRAICRAARYESIWNCNCDGWPARSAEE